jgi:hypothetical protein
MPCGAWSPSVRRCHLPDSFRPCRSSRLRRFAPPRAFQVCCALVPIVGFARLLLSQPLPRPFPRFRCAIAQVSRLALPVSPRGPVWTSPCWFVRLLRGGDVHAIAATGSSVGCVGFPTGAPPFEAFPLPAAGAASTVPRSCAAARSRTAGRTRKFLPLYDIALVWCGPPRSFPSRRCLRLVRPVRVPSASGWSLSGLPWSVTRPQGFVPPSSP